MHVSSRPLFLSDDDDDGCGNDDNDLAAAASSVKVSTAIPVVESDVRSSLKLDDDDGASAVDVVNSAAITAVAVTAVFAAGTSGSISTPPLSSHAEASFAGFSAA